MKYMFVSDIHGSVDRFEEILQIFENEKADKLVLLGDTAASMSKSDNEQIAEILNNASHLKYRNLVTIQLFCS